MIRLHPATLCFLILTACIAGERSNKYSVKHYQPNDEHISITGRVQRGDSVTMYWSATSVKVRFKGSLLRAHLRDEKGKNYFNVVIDGDSVRYIRIDSVKQYYTLASGLPEGEHTVELVKGTEWDRGRTWFYGMQVMDGELLAAPPAPKRTIEFFGNSITAGYAIDDITGGDSPDSSYTNNYHTYAAITARHFNAALYCTVKSGIGITVSWFPLIMPEMYDRLDPSDSASRWDFSTVTPDIVVVNLMQNDSWLVKMPDHPSFKQRFGSTPPDAQTIMAAYESFLRNLRQYYPNAQIICAMGSMDATRKGSPWPKYVEEVVSRFDDPKMHTLFFPFTGKSGHPRRDDNRVMADQLIAFIEKNIQW